MPIPEYLLHFSDTGSMTVEVKIVGGEAFPIRKMAMERVELTKLLDPHSGELITRMTFDEHPYEISRFEIHPAKNKLIIWTTEA